MGCPTLLLTWSKATAGSTHGANMQSSAPSLFFSLLLLLQREADARGLKSLCSWLFQIQLLTAGGIKNSLLTTATLAAPQSLSEQNNSMQLLLQELRGQMLLLVSLLDPPNPSHAPGDILSCQVLQFNTASTGAEGSCMRKCLLSAFCRLHPQTPS